MADALVLGTSSIGVRVRPPSPAPNKENPNLFSIGEGIRIFYFLIFTVQAGLDCEHTIFSFCMEIALVLLHNAVYFLSPSLVSPKNIGCFLARANVE